MTLPTTGGEYIAAAGKASPAITVAVATVSGLALQDWVLAATLFYTVLQTVLLIYNFFKARRNGGK